MRVKCHAYFLEAQESRNLVHILSSVSSYQDHREIVIEIMEVAEAACYFGASMSALIAKRLHGMKEKTFINKIFFLYFTVDAIMGTLYTFSLFRVYYSERFENYNFLNFNLGQKRSSKAWFSSYFK